VYFGYPQAHEDDAERAVRAVLDIAAVVAKLETRAGEDINLVHANFLTDDEFRAIANAGASVSITPEWKCRWGSACRRLARRLPLEPA
jgi:predicted amidohydrolase YtcJ